MDIFLFFLLLSVAVLEKLKYFPILQIEKALLQKSENEEKQSLFGLTPYSVLRLVNHFLYL
jgi:hypothetical protein